MGAFLREPVLVASNCFADQSLVTGAAVSGDHDRRPGWRRVFPGL